MAAGAFRWLLRVAGRRCIGVANAIGVDFGQ
jgi:hypothetical protein